MTLPDNAISLTLEDVRELPADTLKALYRITGRSTVELRESVHAGEPVYTASLFGDDHITVVPRLEKAIDYLEGLRLTLRLEEWVDGQREVISRDVLRQILGGGGDEVD